MNKSLLMGVGGTLIASMSFGALALNEGEMERGISASADVTQADADRILRSFEKAVRTRVDRGERVILAGFGSYSRGIPSEKKGRDPRTGQPITYTVYHTPKNQPQASFSDIQNDIAAEHPDIDPRAIQRAMWTYQSYVKGEAMTGSGFYDRNFGSYQSVTVHAHNRRLPDGRTVEVDEYRTLRFRASKTHNAGMKFKAAEGVTDLLTQYGR